jgi:integrase
MQESVKIQNAESSARSRSFSQVGTDMKTIYGRKAIRYLPDNEIRALIKRSSQPLLLEVMYFYGLRRAEVGLIKSTDVESDGIWITALKRRGNYRQFMPFSDELKNKIQSHLASHNSEYLFPGYNGKGISGTGVAAIWKQVCPELSAHGLRHARAMWFSENGLPIEECSWWLRHSSISSTQVYYSISATRAKKIAAQII